jgi:conjugative transfer signal peptidase TraF
MNKNRRSVILISTCGFAFFLLLYTLGWAGFRLNVTNSLPVGIYRITPPLHRGSYVEFCLSGVDDRLSMERGYRPRGACPDGGAPYLKQVLAVPGDRVSFSAVGITVNGRLLPKTAPFPQDRAGRPLHPWIFGEFEVAPNELWVGSTYNRYSYDSRYYGPIHSQIILYSLKRVLTFSAPE